MYAPLLPAVWAGEIRITPSQEFFVLRNFAAL